MAGGLSFWILLDDGDNYVKNSFLTKKRDKQLKDRAFFLL
jgi:hypothetical protein